MLKRLILLCVLLQFFNCEDIIGVDDISEESIVLLAPTDNTTLQTGLINFSWQELNFGETYHLQIATPNFEMPQQIVEDTLIMNTNVFIMLPANTYQWQVKSINSAYETQFTTQNLTVEE
ncbi:hypothetical protein [Psychroserpens damuponensis]|uniref:hypothetical protein n=1 Tax=Psychroserpens damuponensis TaxID=943936 RepID=UPI000694612B|nr:hypothetical protein [Psychroserpens damuponensis]